MSDPLARLEQIEVEINELYVNRLVFSAAKVKRLLAMIRTLKGEIAAILHERPYTWQPIVTAPKDRTIIGAHLRAGRVWRVHEMRHNGATFCTTAGEALSALTHWIPLPEAPDAE